MKINNLSTDGILSLHNAVKEAITEDDNLPSDQKRFGVREHRDWRIWSDALEAEMDSRKVIYKRIKW